MAQNSEVDLFFTKNFPAISLAGVQGGNLAFCMNVVKEAKPLAPFDLGQLRNSIQYVTGDGKRGGENDSSGERSTESIQTILKSNEAAFGATADYSIYLEVGTRNQAPQPYLRPAIALAKGSDFNDVLTKIKEETARGVLRAGLKRENFI